ncbi:T9SS type A sorting domain-containing protein [Adhaeribacter sp. BT258]|uniref:T9SS type A sorting domain-containing protein n=1 Tax=Adhaeribacter terrigena TaxID=2793070 RepID=A0ABS1BYA3_9BACT|nr:T9SS type A sorting domain-containing protein [Adhaeribacter terrigena]MBK0401901.1 T9SS type A sorting domain-containing protein [Adhaeribacter terrigena]
MRKFLIVMALILLFIQSASAQFYNTIPLTPLAVTTDTQESPQSKIWFHDDFYWTVLTDSAGTHVWRLDGTTWTRMLTLAKSTYARADCKVVGNVVHVILYRKKRSFLLSIEYVPESSTYKLWSARPERVLVLLDDSAETATIDIDTRNRMWIAYDDTSKIYVRWSDSPYSTWSDPITVVSGVKKDDICALIAMPVFGKVGILWSNQNSQRFGFRTHPDGSDPTRWNEDEVPASQSAVNFRGGMANDHLNMTLGRDGTLYCAVKTNYGRSDYPNLGLLVRRPNGSWDNLYPVSPTGTKGIVLLNEVTGKLRVVYTAKERGGNIMYRESFIAPIAFGQAYKLMNGEFDHSTSIKNNTSPNTLVIASDSLYSTGVLAFDAVYLHLEVNPNPSMTTSEVKFSVPGDTRYSVDLYNVTGNLVFNIKEGYTKYGEKHTVELDAKNLPYGLYMVRLQTEKRSKTIKLIRL